MEEENHHLQVELESNVRATDDANERALELLDKLETVWDILVTFLSTLITRYRYTKNGRNSRWKKWRHGRYKPPNP